MNGSPDESQSVTAGSEVALETARAAFEQTYPAYRSTSSLDQLRSREYGRLDEQGQVYLDYTGGSLYSESQVIEHLELLRTGVFGNPHSTSPAQ